MFFDRVWVCGLFFWRLGWEKGRRKKGNKERTKKKKENPEINLLTPCWWLFNQTGRKQVFILIWKHQGSKISDWIMKDYKPSQEKEFVRAHFKGSSSPLWKVFQQRNASLIALSLFYSALIFLCKSLLFSLSFNSVSSQVFLSCKKLKPT